MAQVKSLRARSATGKGAAQEAQPWAWRLSMVRRSTLSMLLSRAARL